MSEIEKLNAFGAQDSLPNTTEGMSFSNQQQQHHEQQYQEQQDMDNTSENIPSASILTESETPQSPTQVSNIDLTNSLPDHNYNSPNLSHSPNSSNLSHSPNSPNSPDSPILSNSYPSITQSYPDYVPFNPISFLNTMHQKSKDSKQPPAYSYSHDPITGHFYCQVDFFGKTYKNEIARQRKQQAKEEAANIAMKDLSSRMPEITDSIRQELVRANNKTNQTMKNPYCPRQSYQHPHPLELIPKSAQWYERQEFQARSIGQPKRPCVLLLEFCQMHKLGHPTYTIRDDGRGYYLFDCTVYNRTYNPQMSFWKKAEAKDHVSNIAFNHLFKEFVEKEQREIQESYRMSQPMSVTYPPLIYPNVSDGSNYAYY